MTRPRTLILGHRGASAHLPENTLASYEAAIREGADGIESDIHLSRDGRLLMFHDPTLDRTTDGHGNIRDQDWVGGMEHVRTKQEPCQPIPLFEELVALIMRPENRHVILNIDVKITSDPHVLFPLIARELDSYSSSSPSTSPSTSSSSSDSTNHSLNSRIILGLWHPLFLPPALTHLPHVKRYHIGLSPQIALKYFWENCHGFSMNVSLLATPAGEAFLTKCEREGKEVVVWTVNDEPGLRRCRERGVGVITDRVGWAVRVREEWEKDPSLIPLSRWEHFRWSWFNWRHYAIPQAIFLRWVEDKLTKNAFQPGPLEDALYQGAAQDGDEEERQGEGAIRI